MKIVATSDLHGFLPRPDEMPDGDLLVVAGDIMRVDDHSFKAQVKFCDAFEEWLDEQNKKYIYGVIGVGGNHDFLFDPKSSGKTFLGQYPYFDSGRNFATSLPWHYLEDEMIEINGVSFYGTPYVPNLRSWAFYSPEDQTADRFNRVPYADVVISHGPPYRSVDLVNGGPHVGSGAFANWIQEIKPKVVITGHIHEAYGLEILPMIKSGSNETRIYNVSYVNRDYIPSQPPILLEV